MASGVIVPNVLSIAFSVSSAIIIENRLKNVDRESGVSDYGKGPWTPPQWSQPALTILTVPAALVANADPSGPTFSAFSSINYVFDAVMRVSHRRTVRKTQHPVLIGASISDHAYVEGAKLTLEIGMSDSMASFASNGAWVGWSSKSVSAWNILKGLQINRTILTIKTRLDTYSNMLIEDCFTQDENKTRFGLRATIILGEVLMAGVMSESAISARPQTSVENPAGVVQGVDPDPAVIGEHVFQQFGDASSSGFSDVSSNSLGQLPQ